VQPGPKRSCDLILVRLAGKAQQVLAAGLESDLSLQLELDSGWRASRRHVIRPGVDRCLKCPRLLPVMMMMPMMMVVVRMLHPHHDLSLGRDRSHTAEEEKSEQ
jgi:hypothetical protein